MRISQGRATINGKTANSYTITYPDDVVFAYNPMYINVELVNDGIVNMTYLDVEFNGRTIGSAGFSPTRRIRVNLYKGKARIYYSRILELFFDNVKSERVKIVSVAIKYEGAQIATFNHTVVWGSLAIGDRFDSYGVFKFDSAKPYMERNRIWFKNFPFTITLFQPLASGQGALLKAKYDANPYNEGLSLYSPMFTMYVSQLAELNCQGNLTDTLPSDKNLDAIVYAEDKKRFYGIYDENKVCGTWHSKFPYYYDSTYYVGANGRPRTDMKWGWTGDHSFYRYDKQTDRLIKIPYGFFGDCGLFELDPGFTFPEAKELATYKQDAPAGSSRTSVFDETFDFTFFNSSEYTTITNLIVNNDTAGYYLRWIDRFGCFQYFLFTKGEATVKNKLSGNSFVEMEANDGMWFPNHVRDIHVSATDTRKCQANSLTDDIYAYVSSIITSPIIDLYLGKTKVGEEIWCPVNIVASSHKHKPRNVLHNLEISFTMPDIQAQTL